MISGLTAWKPVLSAPALPRPFGRTAPAGAPTREEFRRPGTQLTPLVGTSGLRVGGDLDRRLAEELKARARVAASAVVKGAPRDWVLDLAQVTAWDAAGVAALAYAGEVAALNGRRLVLWDLPPALRAALQRAQLHHMFAIGQRPTPPTPPRP